MEAVGAYSSKEEMEVAMNINEEDALFSKIQKAFFLLEPVDNFLVDLTCMNKNFDQEKLVLLTIHHHIIKRYPNKIDYTIRYLKIVIGLLESNGIEVMDSIYHEYFNLIKINTDDKKFYYRHFIINQDVCVIKNTYSMISRGTTGLCIWEGAMVLAEWCLQNKNLLKDKVVLELGCGVGLAGLIAIKHCNCKQYTFSDCNNEVLAILKHNIHVNIEEHDSLCLTSSHVQKKNSPTNEVIDVLDDLVNKVSDLDIFESIKTEQIESINEEECNSGPFCFQNTPICVKNLSFEELSHPSNNIISDVILASDVVYDKDLFPSLKNALVNLLNQNCIAIFSCKVRNMDTYESFVNILKETGMFQISDKQIDHNNLFFFSDKRMYSLVKLLIIRRKS